MKCIASEKLRITPPGDKKRHYSFCDNCNLVFFVSFVFCVLIANVASSQVTITESFETTVPPTGWTSAFGVGTIYNWEQKQFTPVPNGSSYACYNSAAASAGNWAMLTSQVFDLTNRGSNTPTVSLYMYRSNSYLSRYDYLEVYVNTTNSLTGATLLSSGSSTRINRPYDKAPAIEPALANTWVQYSYNIPAGYSGTTNYIIFKAMSANGDYVSIDQVQITSYPCTPPTIATTTPATGVGANTYTLGATASQGTVSWYAAATGGNAIATGTSYTTPSISATTTYYAGASYNGCVNTTRTPVVATVASHYDAGTGVSITGTTLTNTAPDQTVTITGTGATTVDGTYPNFTINSGANYTPGNGLSIGLDGTTLNSLWTKNTNNDIYNNNGGNVGIGTSNPVEKLDVVGNANIRGYLSVQNGVIIGERIYSDEINTNKLLTDSLHTGQVITDSLFSQKIIATSVATGTLTSGVLNSSSSIDAHSTISINGTSNTITSTTPTIGFGSNNISTTGNLTATEFKFHNGTSLKNYVAGTGIEIIDNTITNTSLGQTYSAGSGLALQGSTFNSVWSVSGNDIYSNNSGNLGIGTSNPVSQLQVGEGSSRICMGDGFSIYESVQVGEETENQLIYSNASYLGFNEARNSSGEWHYNGGGNLILSSTAGVMRFISLPSYGNNSIRTDLDMKNLAQMNINQYGVGIGVGSNATWRTAFAVYGHSSFDGHVKIGGWEFNGFNNLTLRKAILNTSTGLYDYFNAFALKSSADNSTTDLIINGQILTKEVNIIADIPWPWPDYVFNDEYKLTPLKDLEKFVKQNKHLPDVPSASEIKEKGINVGEINTTLLKKVEELTLHLIQQNKEIEILKKEVQNLKK